MDQVNIEGLKLTKLKQISHPMGDIYHAFKSSEEDFSSFGEAYFSFINQSQVKGWKKHSEMQLNFVVPRGEVKIVVYDDRDNSKTLGEFFTINLSPENYYRLHIPPKLWVGFKGLGKTNMILNLASIEHDPTEAVAKDLESINYDW